MTNLESTVDSTPPVLHRGVNTSGWTERRKARLQAEAEAPKRKAAAEVFPGAAPFAGGACEGLWTLFDPPGFRESRASLEKRWERAQAICSDSCPLLVQCRNWYDGLPEGHRPGGVIAGEIRSPLPGRKGKAA